MKKHLQVVVFIVSFLFIALYPTEAYISQCHPSRINSMPLKTRKLCMALSFFLENSPQREYRNVDSFQAQQTEKRIPEIPENHVFLRFGKRSWQPSFSVGEVPGFG